MQRALALILSLLALGPSAQASDSFRDAFTSYTKLRYLEHKKALLPIIGMEGEEAAATSQKLSSDITQTRIDFFAVAKQDAKLLSDWELRVLHRVEKGGKADDSVADKQALDFLTREFPKNKILSLSEWDVVREWFGRKTEEALLKISFQAQELPKATAKGEGQRVILVRTHSDESPKGQTKADFLALKSQLQAAGFVLELLEISPFAKADDQATELLQQISQRAGKSAAILVSQGQAGSVIYRALDIYPGLRKNPSLAGWVNLNGKVYGEAPSTGRALASLSTLDPITASANESKVERQRLYREYMQHSPPLLQGFPIMNLVSLEQAHRPKGSLRESVVPEGTTWITHAGKPERSLPDALSLISQAAPDAGLRDSLSADGF